MTVQRGSESRTRIAVASQGDRTRAFRRARVNTWFVRFVKIGLPLIAVIALAVYGGRLAGSMSIKSGPVSVSGITIDPENVVVDRPTYDGFAKDGSRYQIRAKSAAGDLRQTGPIKLTDITGDIFQPNGVVTRLTAVRGLYDSKKSELELFEAITIAGSNGLKARLTHAMIWNKEGRIVSKEPVVAELPTATINARSMEAFQKKREANFAGDVHVRMFPAAKAPSPDLKGAADAAAAVAVAKTPRGPGLPGTAMKSDAPIDVWSETLAVNDDAKTALFKTKVRAVQDAATLESQELEVHYTGKASLDSAPAGTKPKDETAGEAAKLKLLLGRGGVTMVSGPESRATSDDLSYDAESQIAILIGRVVMTSGADKRAVAARAEMDQLKDTALLVGGVHVVQSRNELWGERLMVDRKAGTMHLDSPAAPGKAAGRIKAHLVQTETPEAAARKAAAAAAKPATEAATASPLGVTFRTNPNAPIDIDADTLDANDKSKTAIFRGNVVSRQDEFVMKTPEMIAHYAGESGLASAGLVPSVPKKKGEGAQLTKVEARTKVFVTSKGGQTANGDWAIYDVKTNTVIVGGNVVVTRGKDVVQGQRLKIDLTTGMYRFEL
ncbi:MAG TPA: LptA/OstA family protein, partial [Hyphomicrobiaceae bacterium]|nr:LptA/OstA family protein [Hyphomicrobiaceae bacterium]